MKFVAKTLGITSCITALAANELQTALVVLFWKTIFGYFNGADRMVKNDAA